LIVGYARVSTTERNLGLRHDELKPAFDASVDVTDAQRTETASGRRARVAHPERRLPDIVVGVISIVLLLMGRLSVNVHGMLAFVVSQAAW
jgi:hypothetical protein